MTDSQPTSPLRKPEAKPVPQWMVYALMAAMGVGGPVIVHNQESDKSSLIDTLRTEIEHSDQRCNELRVQDLREDMHRSEGRK